MLNKDFKFGDYRHWVRSIVVIVICLLITAPQLYFAWTVSVAELGLRLQNKISETRKQKPDSKFSRPSR